MDSNELSWERNKWGISRGQGYFAKRNEKKQTSYNQGKLFEDEERNNWRASNKINRNGNQNQFLKRIQINDDEKFWSRGGEVILTTAKNRINEMCMDDYTGEISSELLEPKLKMQEFLNNEKKIDVSISESFMKIILKDSEEKLFEKPFRNLLIMVLGTNFATKRIDSLINVDLVSDPRNELLNLIIKFLTLSFETLPGLAYDIFYARVENLHLLVSGHILKMEISSEMISDLKELRMLAINCCPVQLDGKDNQFADSLRPPDDFRTMSIFPTKKDLFENESQTVFLRENKYLGSYQTVDHYLDVQFRLMREDFVRPLREGIRTFKNNIHKSFDVRVYRNVKLLDSVPDRKLGIIHNIQLDQLRLQKINWSESKRFMSGALLCFSADNFETFELAVVAKRTDEDIIHGVLSVKFIDVVPPDYREYTLLESTNLFESYRHVLLRLQNMTEENFCMKEYFVYGEKEISLPDYLVGNGDYEYVFEGRQFRPDSVNVDWPCAVDLEMNESQIEAFRMALTKKIAIIQGPPGTGKTYVGLDICRCLLENVRWNFDDFGPILVVCYTNHALDQFLTGISKFTEEIVRVGGGCKSEHIRQFALLDGKRRVENFSRNPVFKEMTILEAEMEFRRNAFKSLIKLEELKQCISMECYNYFLQVRIEKWLKGESMEEEVGRHDAIINRIVEKLISQEIHMHLRDVATETYYNPTEAAERCIYIDISDSESEEEFFTLVRHGFRTVNNASTKRLFKLNLKKQTKMSTKEAKRVTSLDDLLITDRWRLYRYWRSLYVVHLKQTNKDVEDKYDDVCKRLNEIILESDTALMLKQKVIGMTTTGAAKYGKILEKLSCKIVIVEEAAEVLESHIISALNSNCEHLILIGDHKQLRPNPAVYELAKKFGLDLSLFERLIINGLSFTTLTTQHRMRPEIADIMRFIYSDLKDHNSVFQYPDVPAIRTNLFFFNHFEREQLNEDIISYSNKFEADLVIRFCRHLLGNGVASERITILTLYSGQHFLINSLIDDDVFEGVRVCVVDNYQGEENDIILLSLVRSNEYEQIGFLSIENRICVSLSRAKHGLYVFGNFDILSSKNPMWMKICEFMKQKQCFGKSLNMYCQIHSEKQLSIETPADFDKYPDYGCEQMCRAVLKCGHICPKFCHYLDKNHVVYKCMEDCTASCIIGHPCKRRCHEECGECLVDIEKIVPGCNHKEIIPCYKSPKASDCQNPCERVLPCRHSCTRICSEKCSPCLTIVRKTFQKCGHSGDYMCHVRSGRCDQPCDYVLKCGHVREAICGDCCLSGCHSSCDKCSIDVLVTGIVIRSDYSICKCLDIKKVDDYCSPMERIFQCVERSRNKEHVVYNCMEDCTVLCINGHQCKKRCHEICDDCLVDIEKIIPECNHKEMIPCFKTPKASDCRNPCEKVLPCGHSCTRICSEICSPCLTIVRKTFQRCGHSGDYMCHVRSSSCVQPCDYVLKCGHVCNALCGDCWLSGCHSSCNIYCMRNLFISNLFLRSNVSTFKYPCIDEVGNPCSHMEEIVELGERSISCTADCMSSCKHKKCTRSCQDTCDRDPCQEECQDFVKCTKCNEDFKCYGMCGEKCQEMCIGCVGNINENSRYITLLTCGHSFEVEYLDEFMSDTKGVREIVRKVCPQCGVAINRRSCFRYMNVVKENSLLIDRVRNLIARKIDSFEYSSYYRILHRLNDFIFLLFSHYRVENYLVNLNEDILDSLYYSYFHGNNSSKHVLVYKYRCSVILLYMVYTCLHAFGGLPCSQVRFIATGRLIDWLNPNSREFDDDDMYIFISEHNRIRSMIIEERDKDIVLSFVENTLDEAIRSIDIENESSEELIPRCDRKLSIPSEKLHLYLENLFIEGFTAMRAFKSRDRRWFICENGHIYNNGESLQTPPRCPICYPNLLSLKKRIVTYQCL